MNDFLEELARLEIEPEEVREILRRLAREEFQMSDKATVLDVAEATSSTPETIGRILADIRGKPWAEWKREIELSIQDHARRLQLLEAERESEASDIELYERVERGRVEKQREGSRSIGGAIALLFSMMVVGMLAKSCKPGYPADTWYPGTPRSGSGQGSKMYGFNGACVWSEEGPDGKPRPITNKQDADQAMIHALSIQGQLKCPP